MSDYDDHRWWTDHDKYYEKQADDRDKTLKRAEFISRATSRYSKDMDVMKLIHDIDLRKTIATLNKVMSGSEFPNKNVNMLTQVFQLLGNTKAEDLHKALLCIEVGPFVLKHTK